MDQNNLAEGKSFLDLGFLQNSPDHKYIAYSLDEDGDEAYRIYVKNLETGVVKDLGIDRAASSFEWLSNSKTFVFTMLDQSNRPTKVVRSEIGDSFGEIKEIFEESDPGFFLSLDLSDDKQWVFICLHGNNSSEYWYSRNNSHELKVSSF